MVASKKTEYREKTVRHVEEKHELRKKKVEKEKKIEISPRKEKRCGKCKDIEGSNNKKAAKRNGNKRV